MTSIRIAPDVEAIALKVAKEMGLGSGRAAIEAIVRCHWQQYISVPLLAAETPSEQDQRTYQVIRG